MNLSRLSIILSYCLIVFLSYILLPLPAAHAQWRDASFGKEYDAADTQGEVNSGAYVDRVQKGAMASVSCQILPVMGLCTEDPSRLETMYNKSVIGSVNGYIAM